MVKGIINAFDPMKLCLVIYMTKGGIWAITQPPIFSNGYITFATTFLPGSKYLLPAKKVNF